MNESEIYPWQREQWEALNSRLLASGLAHALLLHGEHGVGVGHFAECFVRVLLCLADEKPCTNCRACRLYAGGNHPDFREITPTEQGRDIKIAQVRDLADYLQTTRHYGEFKIVLMENADAMNRAAANGLLKTLEEPPANTLIILTSHSPFRMPATVRSRCQSIRLACNDRAQARNWLAGVEAIDESEAERRLSAHRWRPLHALGTRPIEARQTAGREDFLRDINALYKKHTTLIEVAEKWHKQPVLEIHRWLLELAEIAITRQLREPSPSVSLHKLFSFYDRQKYRYFSQKIRFDPRLLIESALIEWQSVYPQGID